MENLGLIAIVVAWAIQLLGTSKKIQRVNPMFLAFYAIGAFLLAANAYFGGMTKEALVNIALFVLSLVVFWRTTY